MLSGNLNCAFAIVCLVVTCRGAKLGCDRDTMEKCSVSLFFFAKGPDIAVSAEHLQSNCTAEEKDMECLQEHTKNCLDGITKGLVQLILDGITTVTLEKCTKGNTQYDRYLKNVVCINTVGHQIHRCSQEITAALEAAVDAGEKKHKIGYACCSFVTYRQCVVDSVRGGCSDEEVEYAEDIVHQYAGDILDAVCTKYRPGGDGCKSLPKLKPAETPKNKSLLPPLSDILQTFG